MIATSFKRFPTNWLTFVLCIALGIIVAKDGYYTTMIIEFVLAAIQLPFMIIGAFRK